MMPILYAFTRATLRSTLGIVVLAAALPLVPHDAFRLAREPADLRAGAHDARLNLLLVTLDTTRADRIGAYGDPRAAETPALDRLAREGTLFEDATSPAPLTLPAHCTLLTGRLPSSHGVRENVDIFDGAAPTLARVLQRQGYRTAAFVGSSVLARSHGLNRGFEVYDDDIPWGRPGRRPRRRADAVVDRALGWIDTAKESSFFAWIHVYDAHAPYESAPPFDRMYGGRPYEAAIASIDAQVGRLRAFLDRRGLTERTVVVAIGDHGEGLSEHGELTHGLFVYQSVLRVPFIIRAPMAAAKGRRVKTPVSGADLMPTLLDLLGLDPVNEVDGRSLLPVILQPGRDAAPDIYAENLYVRRRFGWSEMRAIRSGAFKLIDKTNPELYDLRRDPGETHDLSARLPAVTARLTKQLQSWHTRLDAEGTGDSSSGPRVSDDIRTLASLGYVAVAATSRSSASDPRDHVQLFNWLAAGGNAHDVSNRTRRTRR